MGATIVAQACQHVPWQADRVTNPPSTIHGTVMQTPEPGRLEVLPDCSIRIASDGRIVSIQPDTPPAGADVVLGSETVLLPGLIDTHLHAPQWPQLGTGLDLPLEQWLFEHTFPLEARYADTAFAASVWERMVPTLLAHGTTTVAYHGSIHVDATTLLAEACVRHGQRALIGRVAMDHPDGTPEWYRDPSASASVDRSLESITAIRALDDPFQLVRPVVTPRFVPACTDAALVGLGELAASTGTTIQTHCSESDWEHAHVLERTGTTDSTALDRFGLLREHTLLAHATHIDDSDRHLIAGQGAAIGHCPLSNSYFADRAFSASRALGAGIAVGLGTDVAGGSSPSLLSQCSHAVTASRQIDEHIDIVTAFWMATVGGAMALGLDVGLLAPDRPFDAVAVATDRLGIDPEFDGSDRRFEKLVRLAGRQDVRTVWVAGREVAGVTVIA